jgi:hypothetical protein
LDAAKKLTTGLNGVGNAAGDAARRQNQHSDSMGGSMLRAAAFYQVLERGAALVKEATLGTAMYAARTEQLGVALYAVARAHGITDQTIDREVEKVKKLGVTTQDARQNMTRLVAARLDITKTEAFARGSQDMGRVSGEGTSLTMSRMMQAAIGGELETPKSMGLAVNYEKAYRLMEKELGRFKDGLTETEKRQARFNDLIRASGEYSGAYAASMTTVGGAMLSLRRYTDEAKNAIGDRFAGALGTTVNWLTQLAKGTTESGAATADWIKMILVAITAFAAYKAAVMLCGAAMHAFTAASAAAMLANPVFWIAGAIAAVVAFGASWLLSKDKIDLAAQATDQNRKAIEAERREILASNGQLAERTRLLDILGTKELRNEQTLALAMKKEVDAKVEELRKKLANTSSPIDRSAIGTQIATLQGRLANLGDGLTVGDYQRRYPKAKLAPDDTPVAKNAESAIDQQRRAAHEWMMSGQVQQLEGIDRLNAEYQKQIDVLTKLGKLKLSPEAARDMKQGWAERATDLHYDYAKKEADLAKEREKLFGTQTGTGLIGGEVGKWRSDQEADRLKGLGEHAKKITDTYHQIARQSQDNQVQEQQLGIESLKKQEQIRLTLLDQTNAHTLASKIALEQQKLDVRLDFIQREESAELRLLNLKREMAKTEVAIQYAGQDNQIKALQELIDQKYNMLSRSNQADAKDKATLAREQAAKNQFNTIYEGNKRLFDHLKQSAEGIFDAMLSKSQSVWAAMANAFKMAFLTVMKEIVTSQIARSLTGLFTGQKVGLAPSGSTGSGISGRIRGFFGGIGAGSQPVFPDRTIEQPQQPTRPQFMKLDQLLSSTGYSGGMLSSANASRNPFTSDYAPAPASSPGRAAFQQLSKFSSVKDFFRPSSVSSSVLAQSRSLASEGYPHLVMTPDGAIVDASSGAIMQGGKLFSSTGKLGKAGPAAKGALAAGGSMLFMDGMQRGGKLGVLETTAGGAAVGFAYGGPIGAAVGAAVGLVAGLARGAFKTSTQKMKDRILALTGVRVDSNSVLKQAVQMAQQQCGGNFDLFVRSKQGQDLIEMYAQQAGQKFRSSYNPQSFSMAQSGNSLYEMASFTNGNTNNPLSNLPGLGFSAASDQVSGRMSSAGPMTVTLQIDGPATTGLLRGEAVSVIGSPEGQNASVRANRASVARTETTAVLTSPFTKY